MTVIENKNKVRFEIKSPRPTSKVVRIDVGDTEEEYDQVLQEVIENHYKEE